ncbi:uncharacterized protein NPIL_173861 [Nephila pilipes]|uniref:Uncharacterized protein n=1 Tax=Nephila pilipes TaxID=299642 RepID=A0A8X6UL54_NEPPI|nr:uncharacterized protein NPIL_173861 [Nephila pilipes]
MTTPYLEKHNNKNTGVLRLKSQATDSGFVSRIQIGNSINYLYTILCWIGVLNASDTQSKHRFLKYLFDALIYFTCLNVWINNVINFGDDMTRLDVAFTIVFPLTAIMWCMIRRKSKQISNLIQEAQKINPIYKEKGLNVLVVVMCIIPFLISILLGILCKRETKQCYNYEYNIKLNWVRIILITTKYLLYFTLYPTILNIVVVLLCFLSQRCSTHIDYITSQIAQYSPEDFDLSKQLDILKSKAKVYDVLLKIESAFSMPIFLTIIANAFMCSSLIGWFFFYNWSEFPLMIKLECGYFGLSSFLCVVLLLWMAGRLPIALSRFKETFHQKTHNRLLSVCVLEESHLKRDLFNEPDFVLTGCNILPLKRSTIVGLAGTLLTYTVLAMNTIIAGINKTFNMKDPNDLEFIINMLLVDSDDDKDILSDESDTDEEEHFSEREVDSESEMRATSNLKDEDSNESFADTYIDHLKKNKSIILSWK